MSNFLAEKKREIDARLKELKPLAEEYVLLQKARGALEGVNGGESRPQERTRSTARAGGSQAKRGPRGQRREQVLNVIEGRPGVRPSEIANELGIASSQVSNLLRKLRDEKVIAKHRQGWKLLKGERKPAESGEGAQAGEAAKAA